MILLNPELAFRAHLELLPPNELLELFVILIHSVRNAVFLAALTLMEQDSALQAVMLAAQRACQFLRLIEHKCIFTISCRAPRHLNIKIKVVIIK